MTGLKPPRELVPKVKEILLWVAGIILDIRLPKKPSSMGTPTFPSFLGGYVWLCYDPYIEGLKFLHFSMGFSGSKGWLQEGDSFRCSTNAWTIRSWTRKVKPSNRGSSRDGALVESFLMESMTTLPWNMSRKNMEHTMLLLMCVLVIHTCH